MALKRIPPVGKILISEADGSPMMAEKDGSQSWARCHSPASKIWENAMAVRRRTAMKRVRESGGKIEGAAETNEDKVAFLLAVTEDLSPGIVEGITVAEEGAKARIAAVLNDPELGYIRDQLDTKSQEWGSFLADSATS